MNKINNLELRKLVQEYEFLLTDEEYKNELINLHKSEFLKTVGESEVEEVNPIIEDENKDISEEDIIEKVEIPVKLKKIYREIVKLTHPDKVTDEYLNDLYLEATDAINNLDIYSLYKICVELKITFELEEEDKSVLISKIDEKKKRIEMLEKSFIWIWINSKTEEEKKAISDGFKDFLKNNN